MFSRISTRNDLVIGRLRFFSADRQICDNVDHAAFKWMAGTLFLKWLHGREYRFNERPLAATLTSQHAVDQQ